ncbi:MAG: sugar phosphate isomerase/epimerase [Candidatus Acidiferrum sp.]
MKRRTFLTSSIAATALVGARTTWADVPSRKVQPLGVQLYTARDAAKKDMEDTLAKVAEIGYREIEFAGYFDHQPKEIRAMLDRHKLTSPSSHVGYDLVENKWPETLEAAHVVGQTYIVCPMIPESHRKDADGWKKAAELFNRAGEASHKAGIQFAYHNHQMEFDNKNLVDGKLPYDFLLTHTNPQFVKMEMDLCWITAAGQHPIPYFNRYPGRFPLVHVKDWTADGKMAEVGKGAIDWKSIFAHSAKAGIKHYFVEHDEPAEPFESLRTSYAYLRDLRF